LLQSDNVTQEPSGTNPLWRHDAFSGTQDGDGDQDLIFMGLDDGDTAVTRVYEKRSEEIF